MLTGKLMQNWTEMRTVVRVAAQMLRPAAGMQTLTPPILWCSIVCPPRDQMVAATFTW